MRSYRQTSLLFVVASLLIFAGANVQAQSNETLAELLEWTDLLTNQLEWEWVLIRINGVGGLEKADMFSAADTQVVVSAKNVTDPPVQFHGGKVPSQFAFDVQRATNNPKW